MPNAKQATTLRQLLEIRAANRKYIDKINGTLGSAIGIKHSFGSATQNRDPAILIFVPEKINRKWLKSTEAIKTKLFSANKKLFCQTDVVPGGKPRPDQITKLQESGRELAQMLQGRFDRLWCGSQVASTQEIGTLGAFVKRGDVTGFLTNVHLAAPVNAVHHHKTRFNSDTVLYHPIADDKTTIIAFGQSDNLWGEPAKKWYGVDGFAKDAFAHIDASFVPFRGVFRQDKHVDPRVPDLIRPLDLGPTFKFSMDDEVSSIIGMKVFKVGRSTGMRRGTISGFSYEWKESADNPDRKRYTDFLIRGDSASLGPTEVSFPFSLPGDSGSLVCTQIGNKPIALLWGGEQARLRGGNGFDDWSYSTRIDKILTRLKIKIITKQSDLA